MLRTDSVWLRTTATAPATGREFPVNIRYVTTHPFEVRFEFANPTGWVSWTVDRALVLDGLIADTGEGDVRFAPAGDEVMVSLTNGREHIVLALPRAELDRAADEMLQLVPEGRESDAVDWDAALASLAGGEPR
ncbi:SsgA family sporulation/cell division regulator [Amycolatopsis suaedae]|uniref:SsgA family sporulation/cell division regulator n=1 Tax=Amycolatopsis suaedae TaxID=2510978 RepID=A0A4Q7J2N7_9PSEU|nr:SsgA family sporulation/cell division regulator [Amycolatopsis suaedae]RZQ60852.1 SsgA family sporulation/cell division regulator [Amycolatopsis suaedae]